MRARAGGSQRIPRAVHARAGDAHGRPRGARDRALDHGGASGRAFSLARLLSGTGRPASRTPGILPAAAAVVTREAGICRSGSRARPRSPGRSDIWRAVAGGRRWPSSTARGACRGQPERAVHHRQRRKGDAAGRVPAPTERDWPALHRPYSNSVLYPMINVSDNDAATTCWSIVGNAGLYAVAAAAGMTHFSVVTTASWGGSWGAALITAADQAKFFFEMDSLIPREFVGYANYLLSTIAGYESWGSRRSPDRSATRCSSRRAGAPARMCSSFTRSRGSRATITRSRSRS